MSVPVSGEVVGRQPLKGRAGIFRVLEGCSRKVLLNLEHSDYAVIEENGPISSLPPSSQLISPSPLIYRSPVTTASGIKESTLRDSGTFSFIFT